ncbi:MAG: preprotein translocase subunit SecG [Alcaligenaceae bacterium]|nr:preprotein translocase subunit SecG [Alcaligenaceae bacterium]
MPSYLYPLLTVVQVIAAFGVIVLVLLQQGKGADMGSSFGGGSAGSLFGATGAANFFSRATKWVAVVFFITTAGLAYLGNMASGSSQQAPSGGLMEGYQAPNPALPVAPPASAVPGAPEGGVSVPAAPVAPAASSVPAAPATAPAAAETAPEVVAPAPEAAPATENAAEATDSEKVAE